MENAGNKISIEKVRNAVRSYGLQKQLAAELGTSDGNLTKIINDHLPMILRLLDTVGMEVTDKGEVSELKRVLKRCL